MLETGLHFCGRQRAIENMHFVQAALKVHVTVLPSA